MLHLIAFGKISGDKYAYDYVVKDNEYKKIIQHKKEILQNVSPETRSMFTFHVIKSESINFAQIQKEDPYFERVLLSVLLLCVQINHTGKELLFLIFKEITLRNHLSLHKTFYSLNLTVR